MLVANDESLGIVGSEISVCLAAFGLGTGHWALTEATKHSAAAPAAA